MSSLPTEIKQVTAKEVRFTDDAMVVDLNDGRTITVPLTWYPRLLHATHGELHTWRFIGDGEGIHWPELDEDISILGLLAGNASGESQRSLQRWLALRNPQKPSSASG